MSIFLKANWEHIIMANYKVPACVLQPYLPKGVELDLFNGNAYVSLVGFMFKNTSLFNLPIPMLGTFEEINLRFYVIKKNGNSIKRGVVFINETVPYKAVAWIANKLYKEHYTAIKTKSNIVTEKNNIHIMYQWQLKNTWQSINLRALTKLIEMKNNSFEEFIFEHYYGYTKVNKEQTLEYKINHPRWKTNEVLETAIDCDFEAMYGNDFKFLNTSKPAAVFLAQGSAITVNWKRNYI